MQAPFFIKQNISIKTKVCGVAPAANDERHHFRIQKTIKNPLGVPSALVPTNYRYVSRYMGVSYPRYCPVLVALGEAG
jgi:glycine cleavage system regulatory protein